MRSEHLNEIKALCLLALGILLLISLVSYTPDDLSWYVSHPNRPAQNFISITGAWLSGAMMFVAGYGSYLIVVFLLVWAWAKIRRDAASFSSWKFLSFFILTSVVSAFFSMTCFSDPSGRFDRGGIWGSVLANFCVTYLGWAGAVIVLGVLGVLSAGLIGEFLVTPLMAQAGDRLQQKWDASQERRKIQKHNQNPSADGKSALKSVGMNILENVLKKKLGSAKPEDDKKAAAKLEPLKASAMLFQKPEKMEKPAAASAKDIGAPQIKITEDLEKKKIVTDKAEKRVGQYILPPLDLLEDPPQLSSRKVQDDLLLGARLLERTLESFGVQARVVDIERGPAITRYELEPAPGVKVQKFTTLSDDIALAMRAAVVRIVAPIPGKNRVGIEVPNGDSSTVFIKGVLTSEEFRASLAKSKLTLSLGKDIAGKAMVADLAEMPHLMIAGTTGSGKTVCVNGIIISILMFASPDEVRFVMIDPKMVELMPYTGIPHLLCPPVTDARKASAVLNWVVGEMESRYKLLAKEGVRNIKAYQHKGLQMPYIIIIIDELADLMQVSAKTVEGSICRLAQLSRAVGIHLILATQRPSVDVITGVIKANFPARISFKVASKVDSRTVLDMNGAESLLGKGDMLFIKPGDPKPTRGQGNFMKDKEIATIIDFIKKQQEPEYDETILNSQAQASDPLGRPMEKDEFYDDAVRLVIETNQASVSILQRRFRLGYTRAARLIDMMEQDGIVGPYCGSKARDLLVDREKWLLENIKSDGQSAVSQP